MCEICAKSKITRLPFNQKSTIKAKRPLEIIHSDVCGPIMPSTYNNKNYFVTFMDECTHFTTIYLIQHKSEAFECFRKYEVSVTAHFERRIELLKCDNGKEYKNTSFLNFCKSKGIQMHSTNPYNPEQNGTAERLNRMLLEKARAMILESKLSKETWGEAVLCATYLLNRSSTVALRNVTPAKMYFGTKPNLKYLKVFGSLAYSLIPKEMIQGKFSPRSKVYVIVGYTHNRYRLCNPMKRKVISARNIIFSEDKTIEDIDN